ncbi:MULTISPECIES: AEC family transporter [Rickettsia]|uniref:Auxin efflux carrier n=1 Tax=Rickettsia tamurae subsp. buchneri TaxID=1462938 RepID=A0A8E1C0L6_9RICK|nr:MULTISPECIES: AEC family transporter [Rickettsia]EER21765.1 transporter [Rickettsia endosymbiont of Ixodes scapularis]KDO03636.1 auxin efflux carrier [Rickettsia tamurae subsp. buchneri]KJW02598.1 membrane transport family protein [Rickettsia endosymbiont of Ixodes pacificus]
MNEIFCSTLPIFLITLLGSIIKNKWLTSEEFWRGIEKLSYFVLFPAMLFNYVSTADLSVASIIKLVVALIISTILVSIGLIIYQKKYNIDKVQFTSIFQGSIRYNSYIFFGVSSPLLGPSGLSIVAVISSYMIIFTNILSVMIFAYYIPNKSVTNTIRTSFVLMMKLIVRNPLIIASLVGFVFNYSNLELHLGLKKTLDSLSNAALAIGMLNVGAGLNFTIRQELLHNVMFTSFVKLVAFPLVSVVVLWLMSIDGLDRSVGILYSCLPCASTAYVLSRQLDGDPDSMASIITFTTFFSVVTISIIMYIMG